MGQRFLAKLPKLLVSAISSGASSGPSSLHERSFLGDCRPHAKAAVLTKDAGARHVAILVAVACLLPSNHAF